MLIASKIGSFEWPRTNKNEAQSEKKNRSNHGKKREKRFFTGKSTLRLEREGSPHTEIR